MSLEPKKYRSNKTQTIADAATRQAFEDLAQKLEQLARDANTKIDTFPSGAIVFWVGDESTIPSGWSRYTALDGKFPRGMTGTTGAGVTGGSDTHSHTMTHTHTGAADADSGSAHHHTISPSSHSHGGSTSSYTHSHSIGLVSGYAGGGTYNANDVNNTGSDTHSHSITTDTQTHDHGTATGNPAGTDEGQHSHNLTINNYTGSTGTQSTLPSYVDGIWIRKD